MNELLKRIKSAIYKPSDFSLANYSAEQESQEYGACRFEINGLKIISRNAKITPTKIGQFVTTWKRSAQGITQPFDESDDFDLLVVNVRSDEQLGQFIFPKPVLSAKEIISTTKKDGKRGFRVYPSWDKPTSKQAINTQRWQLQYFLKATDSNNSAIDLYRIN